MYDINSYSYLTQLVHCTLDVNFEICHTDLDQGYYWSQEL